MFKAVPPAHKALATARVGDGALAPQPATEGAATPSYLPRFARKVKRYYLAGELYDWVTHPRRFEKVFHTWREKESLRIVSRYAGGSVVADVGCGTGLLTRRLRGERIVGLDINMWNLHRALLHSSTIWAVQGDAESLPLRASCFDVMVCTETLEHLVEPRQALLEMLRALKPGGKLIGSVPSRSWVWKARRYFLSTCPRSEPFHHQFSLDEARAMLSLPHSTILELFRGVSGVTIFFVLQKDPPSVSG